MIVPDLKVMTIMPKNCFVIGLGWVVNMTVFDRKVVTTHQFRSARLWRDFQAIIDHDAGGPEVRRSCRASRSWSSTGGDGSEPGRSDAEPRGGLSAGSSR